MNSSNLYGYVGNDPVNWTDPNGLQGIPGTGAPGRPLPFNPGIVGPPDDQGPLDPVDWCAWNKDACPTPPFGTIDPPKPKPVVPAICIIKPSTTGCDKIEKPDLRVPNQCPINGKQ